MPDRRQMLFGLAAKDFAGALRQLRHPVLILNPKDGMSAVTARAKGIRPNIAVMDLPRSGYPFTRCAVG